MKRWYKRKHKRILGVLLMAAMLMASLWGTWGCTAQGYMGGLGGVLPRDFRQGEIRVKVKGEMCRTLGDGSTPPPLTPMEGMGVGTTGEPMPFSAEIWAGSPVDGRGLRPFSLVYTSPESLAGITVTCEILQGESGVWEGEYALSTRDGITLTVDFAEIGGLIRPLSALLPAGDVTAAGKSEGVTRVTVKNTAGHESVLIFDTAVSQCPAWVEWRDGNSRLHMKVSEILLPS